jgi:ABC-type sulfate transport system substrate-binding protein
MRRISVSLLVALVFPALATGAARDTKLALVAYSTPREAYGQLIPAFQKTELDPGQIVYVRPMRQKTFSPSST